MESRAHFGEKGRSRSVFDTASSTSRPGARMQSAFTGFHRDDIDRTPPREIVTGLLLGDPAPGKFEHRPLWDPETAQTTIDRRVTLPRLRFGCGEGLKDHQ